jgi:hypothetical protein
MKQPHAQADVSSIRWLAVNKCIAYLPSVLDAAEHFPPPRRKCVLTDHRMHLHFRAAFELDAVAPDTAMGASEPTTTPIDVRLMERSFLRYVAGKIAPSSRSTFTVLRSGGEYDVGGRLPARGVRRRLTRVLLEK